MKQRIVTGLIAAIALLGLIFYGKDWMVCLAVIGAAGVAYYEYDRIFFDKFYRSRLARVAVYIAATVLALGHSLEGFAVAAWLVFIVNSIWHVKRANSTSRMEEGVWAYRAEFFGYLYSIALFGFLLPISRFGPHGREYLLLLFLVVFLGDTAAYFVGTRFGRHRLASQLSPKKSVEGAVAGVLFSTIIAALWVYRFYSGPVTPRFAALVIAFGCLGGILGLFGDLFESLLKRSRAIKDSGHLFPGHGGILDRTDGLALAGPAFYLYLKFVLERFS